MALSEKDQKMLKMLSVVAVGALIYLFWTTILPEYENLVLQIEDYRKKVDTARSNALKLNKVKYEISLLENELQKLKRYFPEETKDSQKALELLPKMEILGKKLGIIFEKLEFDGQPISHEGGLYREVRLILKPKEQMKIESVIKFLYALDMYENILDIKNIVIRPDKDKQYYGLELKVSFFMFKPDAFN
jgi:hypothetical protein